MLDEVQLKGYSLEEAFQTGRQICAEASRYRWQELASMEVSDSGNYDGS